MTTMIVFVAAFVLAGFVGVRVLFPARSLRRSAAAVDLDAAGAQRPPTIEVLTSVIDCRAASGLRAMQLLGDVHEVAEARSFAMTSSQLLIRWAKIRTHLLDNSFDPVLVADLSRHLEAAMTYFDLGIETVGDVGSAAGDAVSRIGQHMCRQSPVLVGRIAGQLDGPPRDRSVAV